MMEEVLQLILGNVKELELERSGVITEMNIMSASQEQIQDNISAVKNNITDVKTEVNAVKNNIEDKIENSISAIKDDMSAIETKINAGQEELVMTHLWSVMPRAATGLRRGASERRTYSIGVDVVATYQVTGMGARCVGNAGGLVTPGETALGSLPRR
jgi:septal ring factor EnvC (AmiA/AmiB activator)